MRVTMSNFVKIGQIVAEILRVYSFPKWRPSPSWIFENSNYYLLIRLRDQICMSQPVGNKLPLKGAWLGSRDQL